GTSPYTYNWTGAAYTINNPNDLIAGSYEVIVSDLNGCSDTVVFIITEPTPLVVDVIDVVNVLCAGSADGLIEIEATGGTLPYTYAWTGVTSSNPLVTGLLGGQYGYTVTDDNGCVVTGSVAITEPSTPVAFTLATTDITCFGGTNGEATVNPTGGVGVYDILWSNNETTLTISGLAAGVYTFQLNDTNGCEVSGSAEIFEPTDLITTTTTTNVLCANDNTGSVYIDANGGTSPYTYNWTGAAYTINNPNDLIAGSYEVIVSDLNGCSDTVVFIITEPTPLVVDVIDVVNVLCAGSADGLIEIEATGGTLPYTYAWTGVTSSNPLVTGLLGGQYGYTATDDNGCIETGSVAITEPSNALDFTFVTTDIDCFGNSIGAITVSPTGGVGVIEVLWSNSETTFTISGLIAGVYTFQLNDTNGCTISGSAEIFEPTELISTFTSTDVSCNNENDGSIAINVNGGTPGYNYNWVNSTNSTNNASNLSDGNYEVIITDQNSCADTLTIVINEPLPLNINVIEVKNITCFGNADGLINIEATGGNTPYSYSWAPNGSTNPLINGLVEGEYFYTITDDSGCELTGSFTITEPTPITVSIPPVGPVCLGDAVTLEGFANGGTGVYTFNWDQGLGQGNPHVVTIQNTTTYNLIVTDNGGCSSLLSSITIEIFNNPIIALSSPSSICTGDSAIISANVTNGAGNYTYTWSDNSFSGSGPFTVFPDSTTTYYLNVQDVCGSQINDSLIITVYPYPVVALSPLIAQGCSPLTVEFDESSVTEPGSSYFWNFGDNTYSSIRNPVYTYTSSGQYPVSLTVTSPNGCVSSSSTNGLVNVYPDPVADFLINPDIITLINPKLNIFNNSVGAITWEWSFGDGNTSFDRNPVHTYEDTGSYTVNLLVTNSYGCIDEMSQEMKVLPEFLFYIPNAFSPNGDGLNDTFTGLGVGIAEFEMHIYDRWGENIFSSYDYELTWNGTRKGKNLVQIDVYVYLMKVKDLFGKWHEYNGHVTVVR
ncbi:MAG: PKD domain-containing protein, partial [Bacteroidota bacterium]|nr:PKD domain-containing protein [Bacteroidota bacterium]